MRWLSIEGVIPENIENSLISNYNCIFFLFNS